LFFFPKNTPTVVATSFCASALIDAYEITRNNFYLDTAITSANFILKDLYRTVCGNGFLFSYSPIRGNDVVFNASLLGSKLLSLIYHYTKDETLLIAAKQSIVACCERQGMDGSWVYGMLPVQNWIDSFHTGYNLDSLITYQNISGDTDFDLHIQKGLDFYLNNFFEKDGMPKYYHNKLYPIDIHCPAQLIVTLYNLNKLESSKELIDKVLIWMITNMQSSKGYFYYQIRKNKSSKIPYMRWNNAFVFNALSYYLLNRGISS
jgi:rhamnogalacturonyl hydrolase YesR